MKYKRCIYGYLRITILVPYDFSKELTTSKDLTKIVDIEQKVLSKYNYLKKLMETGEGVRFAKEYQNAQYRSTNYLYATKEELLSTLNMDDESDLILFCSNEGEYRRVPEFKDYEMVFGFDGKVVMLRSKKYKKTLFNVYVGGEYDDPFWYTVYLYMSEGSNELKLW